MLLYWRVNALVYLERFGSLISIRLKPALKHSGNETVKGHSSVLYRRIGRQVIVLQAPKWVGISKDFHSCNLLIRYNLQFL